MEGSGRRPADSPEERARAWVRREPVLPGAWRDSAVAGKPQRVMNVAEPPALAGEVAEVERAAGADCMIECSAWE